METWRFVDTGARSAAENMALDEVFLELMAYQKIPPTLRFLKFSNPSVLVGHHQSVEEEVRIDYCQQKGIEINRRLTGGGAIYWGKKEMGWELYISKKDLRIPKRIEDLYQKMGQISANCFRRLGIHASFRPRNDVEVNGRKISGMGGTELSGAILFQGTILVDFDVDEMLRSLRIPTEKLQDKEIESVKERVSCLKWELGKVPLESTIKESFLKGFAEAFGVRFDEKPITDEERSLLKEKIKYYSSREYIFKQREPLPTKKTLSSILKAPGGIIRVSMALDIKRRIINQILITGDFFSYPKRAIFDLESRLKNSKADIPEIEENIKSFFSEMKPIIPGFEQNHFIQAIQEAIQKLDLIPYGFNEEDTHRLFPVIKPFTQVKRPEVLLLPYCAKKIDCDYRYREGCNECGLCTIGDAIQLAKTFGMDFITIQNYEELESTLERLKKAKVKCFVGSCCEPFYGKHRPDFERIGLPGILVDLERTTCYELGKQEIAFKGEFENQTELNNKLLQKVLGFTYG